MTNLAVHGTTGSISTIPAKERGYNKTVSWQLSEAHHGASLHNLMVLQVITFLHNRWPEFSSIPSITAPTWLDSNPFCPLHKCTASQSCLSLQLLPAHLRQRTVFSLPEESFSPHPKSYPQFLISSFTAFPVSQTAWLWPVGAGSWEKFAEFAVVVPLLPAWVTPAPPHHQPMFASALHLVPFLQFLLGFFWCHPSLISAIKAVHDFASCFPQDILWG